MRVTQEIGNKPAMLAVALAAVAAAATLLAPALPARAQGAPVRVAPAGQLPTDRVIIKWRTAGVAAIQIDDTAGRAAHLSARTGLELAPVRMIADRLDVLRLAAPVGGSALRHALERLNADPSVQYAEADERRYIFAAPNDPRYGPGSDANGTWSGQWYLGDPSATTPAATGAASAWATATGLDLVIAVIDTGVDFTHPDLGVYNVITNPTGKLLPGYDFVCNDSAANCASTATGNTYSLANDASGWDADPSDPGDWISAADLARPDNFFKGCGDGTNKDQPLDSTWHGTRVAGIAAALTNNHVGIAGVAPGAYILPVRTIGKCSGYISDIVSGMYWAAGVAYSPLTGVPANPYPAQVLNLSIGAHTSCTQTEQDAVTAITQAGHVIVAAAGNDGGPLSAPANCSGVLSVAGLRHIGTKVGYSNVSSTAAAVSIAAPAGNCVNLSPSHPYALPCLYSIETTSNEGKTTPGAPAYTYAQLAPGYTGSLLNEGSAGTSFAAPIVSGVVAMMVQANVNLNAAQIIARLQASATPFPVPAVPATGGICHVATLAKDSAGAYTDLQTADCQCTTATCGAGMLNAVAALGQALFPQVSLVTSVDSASFGQSISLDGSASTAASGRTIASWTWSSDPSVAIANASSPKATVVFPALRPLTITLTITDDLGRSATASKTIYSGLLPVGRSGGGGLPAWALGLLAAALLASRLGRRAAEKAPIEGPAKGPGHDWN
jgi:serine protease